MSKVALIITAHPDDAEISMGGEIFNLVKKGYSVTLFIFSVPENPQRILEAERSCKYMGVNLKIFSENKQVSELKSNELVSLVDQIILQYEPDVVFTHWDDDSHDDHRKLFQAVQSSTRLWPFSFLSFCPPNLNSSNFFNYNPNFFVEINIEKKMKALSFHESEVSRKSYPQITARSMAKIYGYCIKSEFAEAFIINKIVSH